MTKSRNRLIRSGLTKGGKIHPLLKAFYSAKQRCVNPRDRAFKNYGGRGIRFRFSSIYEWMKELGPKPGPEFSVDRKNNNGNYEPGNLRWATRAEQYANSRRGIRPTGCGYGLRKRADDRRCGPGRNPRPRDTNGRFASR